MVIENELMGFLDTTQPVPEDLPKRITQYIDAAEKAYLDKDFSRYINKLDSIESVSKQMLLNQQLTKQQFDIIWERYGL